MNTIDDRIHSALDDDDRAFLASLDQGRGMASQMGGVLTGPLGGWSKLIFTVAIILGFALVFSAFRFFTAPDQTATLWWGLVTLGLLMMQGFIKDWLSSRMNVLSMLREVKRLQLQVAELASGKS